MRYTKYKTRAKIVLTGDDDLFANNAGSTYKTTGSTYTNGKTIRFNLNGAFNDVKLSHIIYTPRGFLFVYLWDNII